MNMVFLDDAATGTHPVDDKKIQACEVIVQPTDMPVGNGTRTTGNYLNFYTITRR